MMYLILHTVELPFDLLELLRNGFSFWGMLVDSRKVAESNNIVAGDDIFTTGQFENERLVERWNGSEVERIETLHRGKRAARMRRSTMRLSRSMSSSSARRRR
jgi:hypothetical protein